MEIRTDNFNAATFVSEKISDAVVAAKNGNFDSLMKRLELVQENVPDQAEKKIDKTSKLYEQCQALESFLIKNLLNSMRATVQKSGFMDGGFAGDMYEDMLYEEYAKDFSKNANLGFADLAYLELTGQRGKVVNEVF
ncbi:MAG: rod-binding protein [Treponema sp.]|jgi:flagellar protein FlgJ|nr:rod-binding protein [Treponema sp.]